MSLTPVVPDLPELPSGATLDQVVQWLQQLRTQNLAREPVSVGDPLQKFVTRNELVGFNLLAYSSDKIVSAGSAGGGTTIVGGGGSGAGGTYVPDLTPPSAVTGLTVTATLTNFFVEIDAPSYAQGHGNAYTSIYAANWSGSGPLPTFSDAVEVYQITGTATIAIVPGQIGTTTCFWAGTVSVDGVRQVDGAGPTGGTNGVSATTGKIGNSDLGPLIVQAGNLANGAVTGTKLATAAIDATKFASSIEPVSIVSSVPGSLSTKTIFNTADGKLYRWDGTAYTRAVDGLDLTANSVTTGAIAAGAISAAQISAGAITTSKLAVADFANFIAYPKGESTDGWTAAFAPGNSTTLGTFWPTASASLAYLLANNRDTFLVQTFACAVGDQFYCSMDTFSFGGVASVYDFNLGLEWLDSSGTAITWSFPASRPATTNGFLAVSGSCTAPTNTATARVWLQINGPGATNFTGINGKAHYATNMQVRRMNNASLIVDGAITANKIAANAIAVGTAAIQNGAIVNAMIGNAEIDDAKIVSCAVGKLTAGSVAVGEYIRSTGFVAGSAGWSISGNGNAEFGFAMIRGTLLASQVSANLITSTMIDSRGLSIEDASGNVILSAGKPLAAQIVPGGGNLYKNGDFAVTTAGAAAPPDFFASYNNSGATVVHAVSTTGGGAIGSANYWRQTLSSTPTGVFGIYLNGGWVGFQNNADYVLSFYARVSSGSAAIGSTMDIRWNHGPATQALIINPPLTTGWQRYVVQINFGANTLDANGFATVSGTLPNSGSYIDFSCVQVETGTAASGFAAEVYVDASGVVQGAIGGSGTAVANSLLNSSIADKLSKSAPSILSSTVSINATSGAGFVAGTLTWNSAGVRTGGSGIAMTPGGLLGVNTAGTTTFSIDASTGNAFFGGRLAVGIASSGQASGSASAVSTNGSSVSALQTAVTTCVTDTVAGNDLEISLNVNAVVMTNTNTPVRMVLYPIVDGLIYSALNHYPEFEFTQTNSNPMKLAAGTGATAYNWGATQNFQFTFGIAAGGLAAGSHTFGYQIACYFFTSSGTANVITGSSIYAEGVAVVREFNA